MGIKIIFASICFSYLCSSTLNTTPPPPTAFPNVSEKYAVPYNDYKITTVGFYQDERADYLTYRVLNFENTGDSYVDPEMIWYNSEEWLCHAFINDDSSIVHYVNFVIEPHQSKEIKMQISNEVNFDLNCIEVKVYKKMDNKVKVGGLKKVFPDNYSSYIQVDYKNRNNSYRYHYFVTLEYDNKEYSCMAHSENIVIDNKTKIDLNAIEVKDCIAFVVDDKNFFSDFYANPKDIILCFVLPSVVVLGTVVAVPIVIHHRRKKTYLTYKSKY